MMLLSSVEESKLTEDGYVDILLVGGGVIRTATRTGGMRLHIDVMHLYSEADKNGKPVEKDTSLHAKSRSFQLDLLEQTRGVYELASTKRLEHRGHFTNLTRMLQTVLRRPAGAASRHGYCEARTV